LLPSPPNNENVNFLAGRVVESEELLLARVDAGDNCGPAQLPRPLVAAEEGNVLVRAEAIRLVDAVDQEFGHMRAGVLANF
jgi:hypothetical protein